jgi:hypothetical protein
LILTKSCARAFTYQYLSKYKTKTTGFIPFLQNNQTDILLNPKCSISISVGTTMSINISNIRIQDIEKIDITGSGDNDLN